MLVEIGWVMRSGMEGVTEDSGCCETELKLYRARRYVYFVSERLCCERVKERKEAAGEEREYSTAIKGY